MNTFKRDLAAVLNAHGMDTLTNKPDHELAEFLAGIILIMPSAKGSAENVKGAACGDILANLIDVGTGKIPHRFMGCCPDEVDGHDQRDAECPACRILTTATTKP